MILRTQFRSLTQLQTTGNRQSLGPKPQNEAPRWGLALADCPSRDRSIVQSRTLVPSTTRQLCPAWPCEALRGPGRPARYAMSQAIAGGCQQSHQGVLRGFKGAVEPYHDDLRFQASSGQTLLFHAHKPYRLSVSVVRPWPQLLTTLKGVATLLFAISPSRARSPTVTGGNITSVPSIVLRSSRAMPPCQETLCASTTIWTKPD